MRHNLPFMVLAEAVLVGLKAEEAEQNVYELQVKQDKPSVYFRLSDRKGTRELDNKGNVPSADIGGKMSPGCVLERLGAQPSIFSP